jgi:actin-like ATPase involved in cell morphogenesis
MKKSSSSKFLTSYLLCEVLKTSTKIMLKNVRFNLEQLGPPDTATDHYYSGKENETGGLYLKGSDRD